jgi:hypothetical protein
MQFTIQVQVIFPHCMHCYIYIPSNETESAPFLPLIFYFTSDWKEVLMNYCYNSLH